MADMADTDEQTKQDGHNNKPSSGESLQEQIVPIHKKITDVGQFSYAALCATTLHTLFDTEYDNKFKEEALCVILISLEQPQQVCESVRAMLQGQGQDDVDPYIDILLAEDVLKEGAEPIVSQLLAVAIGQGSYDARMRVFIKQLAWRLKVDWEVVIDLETSMAETLTLSQYEMSEEEKIEKARKAKRRKYKRYALIGLATLGGGTLIGLTGGLAAPLVAAGAGAIIGGTGAAVLGTTTGVAVIGSLFGVAGAGLTGYKMKKRVGAIEEFQFEPLVCGNSLSVHTLTNQLHITIAVTGWLTNNHKDFKQPWKYLAESREQYTLCWETKYLVQMGEALNYIFNSAMTMATQEALKYTVLSGLLAAIAWPSALLSAANIIDNPWSVALQRAQAAGKMLAEVLLTREQGNRPVTLIGFSLGARVLFYCLEELSKRKGSDGIVEDVILLGTPATGDPKVWENFSRVVAGKIVNGYCRGDWLLKFLYRTSSVQLSIAGLRPINWADRRMHNIDLSDVVSGHLDYRHQLDTIMKAVGVRTRDEVGHSSSSLSKLTSAASTPSKSPNSVNISDLSSSDDEVYKDTVKDTSGEGVAPVILEDYSPGKGRESKSSSFLFVEDSRDVVIPESVSFDSGVEMNKESESRDLLSPSSEESFEPTRQRHEEKNNGKYDTGLDKSHSVQRSSTQRDNNLTRRDSCKSDDDAAELLTRPGDRVGDAGASGADYSDTETSSTLLRESSLDEDSQYREKEETVAGSLQRKKLFDSMYRLVLDEDLLDVMNEEDDDGAVG
ncbi:hypothetical protein BsWGS_26719 [Bradybaena similaris]